MSNILKQGLKERKSGNQNSVRVLEQGPIGPLDLLAVNLPDRRRPRYTKQHDAYVVECPGMVPGLSGARSAVRTRSVMGWTGLLFFPP